MSVASVSSFIAGASQIINSSTCRFHTAHRQAPCSGLTLPRRRNAVAYIWQGRLGIEPTQAVLETASPALEHSPLCLPVFPGCQILSVCRFSQRIIGAITTSTLEGLTSGLRITHPTIPLKRCSLAVSTENWCRRLEMPPTPRVIDRGLDVCV